jgi:hypothetical protein
LKLAENVVEIDQSADLQSAGFGFEFNAKMADMLSNKIYSDPILAVVREYICNAVDAHGSRSVARNIDICVPSFIDPTWSVRDYGPGLSQEQIMGSPPEYRGLFNTYGRSDKSNSNKAIGGFGLGSKAGFAYVNRDGAFTVTSWHGGRKKVYTCHKNAKGLPAVTLMSDTASDEHSGIKIAIPVQSNDYRAFLDRTSSVILYMDQGFNVTGTTNTLQVRPEYILKGDRWGVKGDGYGRRSTIIMGGIAYPIDSSQFHGETRDVLNHNFDIFTPIGSVELSVSREALSYEETTITYIMSECARIKDEVAEELTKSIADAESLVEASRQYHNIVNQSMGWFVRNKLKKLAEWKGKKLLYQAKQFKWDYATGKNTFSGYKPAPNKELYVDTLDTLKFYCLRIHYNTAYESVLFKERGWSSSASVNIQETVTFVYDDLGNRYKQRICGLIKKYKDAPNDRYEIIIVVKGCTWRQFLGLYIKSGRHNKYCKLSEIEEYTVPRVPSKYTPPKDSKRQINHLGRNNTYSKSGLFHSVEVDFADTSKEYYYLPTKHYDFYEDFSDATKLYYSHNKMEYFDFQTSLGLANEPIIYLVPFAYKNLVLTNKKWINVAEKLKSILETATNDQAFVNSKKLNDDLRSNWRHVDSHYIKFVTGVHTVYTKFPVLKGTFWEDFAKKAEKIIEISDPKFSERFTVVENILKFFSLTWADTPKLASNVADLDTIEREDINRHLPIIEHLDLEAAINSGNKSVLDSLVGLVVQRDKELKGEQQNGDE